MPYTSVLLIVELIFFIVSATHVRENAAKGTLLVGNELTAQSGNLRTSVKM